MNFKKICSIVIVVLMLLQCAVVFSAAKNISENSSFAYSFTKVEDAEAPGDILATLYCQTDPEEPITTLGATFVINTDYVDMVNKKGEVITDSYKADFKTLGKSSTVSEAVIGNTEKSFSAFKGLSIASYNASTKLMYVFLCGMSMDGIQLASKSKVASLYLKSKTGDTLPAGAIRLMKESELGTDCPSKAVFVTEISSKNEVGQTVSPLSLEIDDAVMQGGPKAEDDPQEEKATSKKSAEQSGNQPAQEAATKAASEMSEQEIADEVAKTKAATDALSLSEDQKNSAEYKAFEKALKKAQETVADENATAEQKQQALEELREAKKALAEKFSDVAEQFAAEDTAEGSKTGSVWLYVAIGAAVALCAAIIIVLIIKNKKKKSL